MHKREFSTLGYTIIKRFLPSAVVEENYHYALSMAEKGNLDDGQVPGSPSFYQDKNMVDLQKDYLPKISEKIGVKLKNVFTYHRVYRTGAILRAHKDSERAEISATINMGQQGKLWALWLLDMDERATVVRLEPGDALVYKGSQLMHWRERLLEADNVVQVMFHCVDAKGKHARVPLYEVTRKIRKKCREWCGIAY